MPIGEPVQVVERGEQQLALPDFDLFPCRVSGEAPGDDAGDEGIGQNFDPVPAMMVEGRCLPAQRSTDIGEAVVVGITDVVEVIQGEIGDLHEIRPTGDPAFGAHLSGHVDAHRTALGVGFDEFVDSS